MPRQRGSTTKLSRHQLLDAALRVLDADGVEALTMRRVAAELGVSAAALYWYVKDKDELLRAVLEHVQTAPDDVALDELEWREALRTGAGAYRRRFLDHPRTAVLMTVTPLTSERGWITVERVLQVLDRAGFRGAELIDAANAYIGYVAGYIALELAMGSAPLPPTAQRQVRARLRHVDPTTFPMLSAHADQLVDRAFGCRVTASPLESGFWFGLERLLDGLAAQLATTDAAGSSRLKPSRRSPPTRGGGRGGPGATPTG